MQKLDMKQTELIKRFTPLVFVSFIVALLLMATDVAGKFLLPVSHKVLEPGTLILVLILALLFAVAKRYTLLLIIMCCVQIVSIVYLAYFGTEFAPEIVGKFFQTPLEDSREIWSVLKDNVSQVHALAVISIFSYSAIIYLLGKTYHLLPKFSIATLLLPIIVFHFPIKIFIKGDFSYFYPNPIRPSLYNGLNSIAFYLREFGKIDLNKQKFLPYKIDFSAPKAQNIILIMGESTRDDFLSFFQPKEQNNLKLLNRFNDINFIYKQGFSSSISTRTSLPIFFNLMLEPGNTEMIFNRSNNLFKLAKQQGYQTILLSAQEGSLSGSMGAEFVDYLFVRSNFSYKEFSLKRDEVLLEKLKTIPLKGKNFIVLHLRSQHLPYEKNYLHRKELAIYSDAEIAKVNMQEADKMKYANASIFTDLLIDQIMNYATEHFKNGKNYVFYTSDHSELFGEDDLKGHGHLHFDCAKVPFFVLGINPDEALMKNLRQTKTFTHYDLGLLIADLFGAKVTNPNHGSENTRYIHGPNLMMAYKYLELKLD